MSKIKVLVVDDHPMVLEGMRSMLLQISFVEITGTAPNAYEAIEKIKRIVLISLLPISICLKSAVLN